jgi:anhydro-N-acetylmuramic acid kinase
MSGTSLDGVDGVLVNFSTGTSMRQKVAVLAHAHRPFAAGLRAELFALNSNGPNELHRAALASNGIARAYAEVVSTLLTQSGVPRGSVDAVGAHGQTVRHQPAAHDGTGYTVQLVNASLLAELVGIDVVADFRSRDLAAGGQGAPLVPGFHRAMFWRPGRAVSVLNIGGMSNLSFIDEQGHTLGFDCGPGNALMDYWSQLHTGQAFDADGAWAAAGRVDTELLERLLAEAYFARLPPKSTGRDLFDAHWLEAHLAACRDPVSPIDVQATLCELTAVTCAHDVATFAGGAQDLLVCGGGSFNRHLMSRLASHLARRHIESTITRGLPADQVEAVAFAWLARAFVAREPASLASVTGAAGARLLGALYPAS